MNRFGENEELQYVTLEDKLSQNPYVLIELLGTEADGSVIVKSTIANITADSRADMAGILQHYAERMNW